MHNVQYICTLHTHTEMHMFIQISEFEFDSFRSVSIRWEPIWIDGTQIDSDLRSDACWYSSKMRTVIYKYYKLTVAILNIVAVRLTKNVGWHNASWSGYSKLMFRDTKWIWLSIDSKFRYVSHTVFIVNEFIQRRWTRLTQCQANGSKLIGAVAILCTCICIR